MRLAHTPARGLSLPRHLLLDEPGVRAMFLGPMVSMPSHYNRAQPGARSIAAVTPN